MGAARKEIEPRLVEATVAGIGESSATGFTRKREPPHELANRRVKANADLIIQAKQN